MRAARSSCLAGLAALLLAAPGLSQVRASREQRPVRGWELPGLDISPNGGWRVKARSVATRRAQLLARRDFTLLNAAPSPASPTVVNGTLTVPAILFRYLNSPSAQYARDTAQYNATLFGAAPPNGKPYTLRTFYEQLSNGVFSFRGQSFGWVALDSNEVTYTGAPGTCTNPLGGTTCNGLFSSNAFFRMQNGLREALAKVDGSVDFSQFDNNGSDGFPNSGDDDGVVDAVLFLHPSMDGACVSISPNDNHLWSHRDELLSTGSVYTTNDNRTGGGKIVVNDYILQSGLGSPSGEVCDSTAIMPIGTAAHELGHLLALPDLYDTPSFQTEGIGEWSLMSSGNYTKPESPTRYDAWSLQQMGWATLVPLTTAGTNSVGPEPTSDTVFLVTVQGANPRNEYFLIENRQAVQSDSAMIRIDGGGGLLLWHIDGEEACLLGGGCLGGAFNSVNSGPIHGVALEEADGLRQLWCESNGCNRGDGGDPYPGTGSNTIFSFATTPAAIKNSDSSFAGFAVDQVQQLVPNGAMSFRLRLGALTVVKGSDTAAVVQVDGSPYNVFRDLLADGTSHTIAVADTQFTAGGRSRFAFQSWSDGGAISHSVTGAAAGASYTANLAAAYRLDVSVGANGTVSVNPGTVTSGSYVDQGSAVTLTAVATAPFVFGGWGGDTSSNNAVLTLPMTRPYSITVRFDPALAVASGATRPGAIMAKGYADSLQATGATGVYTWSIVTGALPAGLTLAANGRVSGAATQTGTFTFTARVSSGAQQTQQLFSVTVTAPTLVASAVVSQLLNGGSVLTTDEQAYLDLIGNNNGSFDVGDFLAWVQATGATPVPPEALRVRGRP